MHTVHALRDALSRLDVQSDRFAVDAVSLLLSAARESRASDIHWLPLPNRQLDILFRVDGLLQPVARMETAGPNIISRLKVLAELLTYRTDMPQEGRIRQNLDDNEMRVSTFPTVHGEKAVVRLFVGSGNYLRVDDLAFPVDVTQQLRRWLGQTQGVLIVSGPAGAGKTTTLYAALRELLAASASPRSVCSLEDPIEALVPGVAQSAIHPAAGFTYEVGLKSLLRQDPEVLMVGEIRDRETAEVVFQASLTGHLVLTTFHAGRAAEACGRLLDMGIEPYILKSGLLGILCQRLVRKLCPTCSREASSEELASLSIRAARIPSGCEACGQSGYSGRLPLIESLDPREGEFGSAILARADVQRLNQVALAAGMRSLSTHAQARMNEGETSWIEILRVLGTLALKSSLASSPQ